MFDRVGVAGRCGDEEREVQAQGLGDAVVVLGAEEHCQCDLCYLLVCDQEFHHSTRPPGKSDQE